MRIEYLHMKNFAPFDTALQKTEVELDYRGTHTKVINILIGEMGSCKTFLLGHHQPFATLGNLDVRNSEDLVLAGKKGLKEIIYRNGDDLYEITHIFLPAKNMHTIKSYVKRNGVELNENGNGTSFKTIIEAEFGLDQSFLKLFRIGSNVTNLPDMSSSERKSFISSMLSDTEIYLMLYKKIGEENRSINAQMTVLINRFHSISNRSEDELANEMNAEVEMANDAQLVVDECLKTRYRLEGAIATLRDGMTAEVYQSVFNKVSVDMNSTDEQVEKLQDEIDALHEYPDPAKLAEIAAQTRAQVELRSKTIQSLSHQIDETSKQKEKLRDQIAVIGSADHVDTLKKTYQDLMTTLNKYEKQLKYFTYKGTMASIMNLLQELQTIDEMVNDIAQYNSDSIKAIFKNPMGSLNRAKQSTEKMKRSKEKVMQEMTNITQVSQYVPLHVMVRPFDCPTVDCPYFKYHPVTEKAKAMTQNVDKVFLEKRNKLNQIDAELYKYEDFPYIAKKLETIKGIWNRVIDTAQSLGVIKEDDLCTIITNLMARDWYDRTKMQKIKELCGIREQYYELMQTVASMRNDLTQYELSDIHQIQLDYQALTAKLSKETHDLEELELANQTDQASITSYNGIMVSIANQDVVKQKLDDQKEVAEGYHTRHAEMKRNIESIASYMTEIDALNKSITQHKGEYLVHKDSAEKNRRKLADLKFTKAQYQETLGRQGIIHDILDAVSSKKGIPLAFIKLFLDDCKDTLNDLISDVFADTIEVQDFDIPEDGTEFNIPYTKNGSFIGDINQASQGERAIISLALSFALIRQRTFPYNIMLLDEVDGPLYKSDRDKFISILFKQIQAIQAEQVFIVSHNNTFDGFNVNIIMTTNEIVEESPLTSIMHA